MESDVYYGLISIFNLEVSNKIETKENEIIVFLADGTTSKIKIKKWSNNHLIKTKEKY